MYRAAVGHEDDHYRAQGIEPPTPQLPEYAPPEAHAERQRAYALGRAAEPGAPPARTFPLEDDDGR
ncbi:MAG: hypothetical protein HY244_09685 [Rhizobiales bacterium]|nr:hypothetical protein [Hyphomicrobiales bacterium]